MDDKGPTRRSAFTLFGDGALAIGVLANRQIGNQAAENGSERFEGFRRMSPEGGRLHIPAGYVRLSSGYTFKGQRFNIVGDGPNVSVIVFDAPAYGAAIKFDNSEKSGNYQSSIRDLGFVSSGKLEKTAVHLINTANINLERLAIPAGGWQGTASIGIKTQGRQFIRIRDCDISCARPLVIGSNSNFSSLAADYFTVTSCELSCTEPNGSVIEVESAATMSNMAIRDTALTGGTTGFRYIDTSEPIAPNMNIHFENIRTEQGSNPEGWSFHLESEKNTIQSVSFINVRMDNRRNGVKLRNVQRLTLINCDIDQLDQRVAIDMVGVPGSVITMINCWGQLGSQMVLRKMRHVEGLRSDIGSPIGPFEVWVYDDGTIQPFAIKNAWNAGPPVQLASGEIHLICRNDCAGRIEVYASNGVSAGFRLFGTQNTSFKSDDPSGQFSTTYGNSGTTNIAYHNGYYVIQNNTASVLAYRYQLDGPGNAGF